MSLSSGFAEIEERQAEKARRLEDGAEGVVGRVDGFARATRCFLCSGLDGRFVSVIHMSVNLPF